MWIGGSSRGPRVWVTVRVNRQVCRGRMAMDPGLPLV